MIIFDGIRTAAEKEHALKAVVSQLRANGTTITIGAIVFKEDAGSQLYTRLKREAAERVGINYVSVLCSITDPVSELSDTIQKFNSNAEITGIIIQKPTKKIWQQALAEAGNATLAYKSADFSAWWNSLTVQIDSKKDVDGLHPDTLRAIAAGTWKEQQRVLPATCQAVLETLEIAEALLEPQESQQQERTRKKVIIVGKSDLLGVPLCGVLKQQGRVVELLTKAHLDARVQSGQLLTDGSIVVSATGVAGLITSEMVQDGVTVIDVGEPRPDIARPGMDTKAAFLTPVPGGVGPMTVICLLENAVQLVRNVRSPIL